MPLGVKRVMYEPEPGSSNHTVPRVVVGSLQDLREEMRITQPVGDRGHSDEHRAGSVRIAAEWSLQIKLGEMCEMGSHHNRCYRH